MSPASTKCSTSMRWAPSPAAAAISSLSRTTYSSGSTSYPLTPSLYGPSLSSFEQNRRCSIFAPSSRWTSRKWTVFDSVAVWSFTGTLMSPKAMVPFQIDRAPIGVAYPVAPRSSRALEAHASGLEHAQHRDAEEDRRHAEHLMAPEPLVEDEVRRQRRDGGELRRQHGGDRDVVLRAGRVRREADHLAQPRDDHQRRGGSRQRQAADHEQRQRDHQHAREPGRQHDPRGGERPAQVPDPVEAHAERERGADAAQRREPRPPA